MKTIIFVSLFLLLSCREEPSQRYLDGMFGDFGLPQVNINRVLYKFVPDMMDLYIEMLVHLDAPSIEKLKNFNLSSLPKNIISYKPKFYPSLGIEVSALEMNKKWKEIGADQLYKEYSHLEGRKVETDNEQLKKAIVRIKDVEGKYISLAKKISNNKQEETLFVFLDKKNKLIFVRYVFP